MTIMQFLSFSADLIAVALMIWQVVRLGELKEQDDKGSLKHYFRRLCTVALMIAVLNLLKVYADVQLGTLTMKDFGKLSESEQSLWYVAEIVTWIADIFLTTVFLYMWITFLSWYLFKDRDFIKRKSWLGFTPLIFSALVTAVSIPMALTSNRGFVFFVIALCVFFVIRIVYFLLSLWLLQEYKKQNGYLRFFNPWTFFIPVFAGWILQDLFSWEFAALGSAIGVVLLYSSIMEEKKYIDPKTGFYSIGFVDYLKELTGKNEYDPCSAMTFTLYSPRKMKDFAGVLKEQLPDNCESILKSDSTIVVLTGVRERTALQMVIMDVRDVFDVEAACSLKKKTETAIEFMERVL
ncbi:MAG: hypothetical protein K6E91_01515 [Butyrivibrio sp.]|nr:hypothetical protein [Butyrivibrio sp.]